LIGAVKASVVKNRSRVLKTPGLLKAFE